MNIRAIALSLALGASPLFAQEAQTPSQDANPHDTKNKDRPSPGKGSNKAVQRAETANPHSTENKDEKPVGTPGAGQVEAAQAGNPHSVKNAQKHGTKKHRAMHTDGGTPDAGAADGG